MKNTYDIFWTEEAVTGLQEIFKYLEANFSAKDVRRYAGIFKERIEIIQSFPLSFPLSNKSKGARKSVMAKLTSIYYTFDGKIITIIAVSDNRKNL